MQILFIINIFNIYIFIFTIFNAIMNLEISDQLEISDVYLKHIVYKLQTLYYLKLYII